MSIKTFELISTTENGVQLISYVALPENASADNPATGILVAPEWWGVVEHPKSVTERLAEAGYAAVAMDVYGEGKLTTDAAMANMWMEQVLADQDMLMARCQLILNDFSDQMGVNGDNLAALWMAVESTGAATVTSTRQVFSAEEIDQIRPNIPGYRAPGE